MEGLEGHLKIISNVVILISGIRNVFRTFETLEEICLCDHMALDTMTCVADSAYLVYGMQHLNDIGFMLKNQRAGNIFSWTREHKPGTNMTEYFTSRETAYTVLRRETTPSSTRLCIFGLTLYSTRS